MSAFSTMFINYLKERMHMMLSETMQLCMNGKYTEELRNEILNDDKLIIIILKEIKDGSIKSVWFSKGEADKAIAMYEYMHDHNTNNWCSNSFATNVKDF
jgi:hypothetical protein